MKTPTPAQLRDRHFATLRARLAGRLARVYAAWLRHGPATTRQLAILSGIDLLSLRPRTTDLLALGLVECVASEAGEGLYRARDQAAWETWRSQTICPPAASQLNLI